MTSEHAKWSDWQQRHSPEVSAYIDWRLAPENTAVPRSANDSMILMSLAGAGLISGLTAFKSSTNNGDPAPRQIVPFKLGRQKAAALKRTFPSNRTNDLIDKIRPPAIADLPKIAKDSIILGIIDVGIGLGNARFRDAAGESRILAALLMHAAARRAKRHTLLKPEIDKLLTKHSGGNLLGALDEQAFNNEAGLVEMGESFGVRDLAGHFAHGTAVTDLAGGCDPTLESDFAKRVKIITVTLPPYQTLGMSGEYLDLYTTLALNWLVSTADHLWSKAWDGCPDAPNVPPGFPLVINLSLGRQAGAKRDEIDLFPGMIADLRQNREFGNITTHLKPRDFRLVMPAGNDNLDRVHFMTHLPPGKSRAVTWRIQPGDVSDNFVEIWFDQPGAVEHCAVSLAPPGTSEAPSAGSPGQVRRLARRSSIYRLGLPSSGADNLAGYLLALGPTCNLELEPDMLAPPGAWTITLHNSGPTPLRVRMMIQTDQSTLPSPVNSRRSYFDEESYQQFDEQGRKVDSYRFDRGQWVDSDTSSDVCRHGTLIASSAHQHASCIGGYRTSDGMPADYSSTGLGIDIPRDRTEVTCSLPTDDGWAHPGILAAGAASGAVIAVRGTSFASAQAARHLLLSLMNAPTGGGPSSHADPLVALAQQAATQNLKTWVPDAPPSKTGHGRLPRPDPSRMDRLGR